MSQFSSSGSSNLTSRSLESGVPRRCWCGSSITTYTSKTDENPGRRFYRCVQGVKDKKDKHLFRWVEDALLEEIRMVESKQKQLSENVYELRKMVKEMEEDMRKKMNDMIVAKSSMEKSSIRRVCVLLIVVASASWLCGKVI